MDQGRILRLFESSGPGGRMVCLAAALGVAVVLSFSASVPALADSPMGRTVEPAAPEILELVLVAEPGTTPGRVVVEAVLRPEMDGEVEVELVGASARWSSRPGRKARIQLRRGGRVHRERFEVDRAGGPQRVRVRAHLLNERGERWLTLERSVELAPELSPRAGQARVPVVRTTPEGRRRVEYMKSDEAARVRGRERAPGGAATQPVPQGRTTSRTASPADADVAPLGDDVSPRNVAE